MFVLVSSVYSLVEAVVKEGPLGYSIACLIIFSIGSIVAVCKLGHSICTHSKIVQCRVNQVVPQSDTDARNQRPSLVKKLVLKFRLGHEVFIYAIIICGLYRLINEKSWQFQDALAGISFIMFVLSVIMDGWQTKCKYIFLVIRTLHHKIRSQDNWKTKLKKYWLPSFLVISDVFLLVLMHWVILAIIGVRIYVDNFSKEINETRINSGNFSRKTDQANTSDTGGYEVTSYTGYMLFCGLYLPIASIILSTVLNRAWLSDDDDKISKPDKIFYCFVDPIAYIAVPYLMVPFIAFSIGAFLPDYDSSDVEVDSNARNAATILGGIFIVIFLLSNVRTTLIFIIVIGIIITIISLIIPVILILVIFLIPYWICSEMCDFVEEESNCNETRSTTHNDNHQPQSNTNQIRSPPYGINNQQNQSLATTKQ